MFGNVVLEIPKEAFEHEFDEVKRARGARLDTELDEPALREVVERYKQVVQRKSGRRLPAGPDGAAAHGAGRGVPLVAEPARP